MPEREPIRDVSTEIGDDVSRMLYEVSRITHRNRPELLVEMHESFSGFRAISGSNFKDIENLYFNLGFDGVGTKVEVAERLNDHSTIAHDLFAMVCDDAVVRGAEPIAVGSILDVRQLDDSKETQKAITQLTVGYVTAAKAAGVVVVNGEVAELGDRVGGYGDFNYNWGATALWVAHKDRILTGHQVEAGYALVGLEEEGFRSNGITDVRKAMQEEYGSQWHHETARELGGLSLGSLVQTPSTIYTTLINELTGGYDITNEPKAKIAGIAHITGGGLPSKLGRMLEPSGLGLEVDAPISPPLIMQHVQKLRGFSDREAYSKWHMGHGMVIVTPEPMLVLEEAAEYGIEAKEIGYVTDEPGIRIKNKGVQQDEEYLEF